MPEATAWGAFGCGSWKGGEGMDASHVATGTITALLATVLVYLSHWPLQPLDLPTASAIAGLLVALGGALVKLYQSRTAPAPRLVVPEAPVAPVAPPSVVHDPHIAPRNALTSAAT